MGEEYKDPGLLLVELGYGKERVYQIRLDKRIDATRLERWIAEAKAKDADGYARIVCGRIAAVMGWNVGLDAIRRRKGYA